MEINELLQSQTELAKRVQEDLGLFGDNEKVYAIYQYIEGLDVVLATDYVTLNPFPGGVPSVEDADEALLEYLTTHKEMLKMILDLKKNNEESVLEITFSELGEIVREQLNILISYVKSLS